MATEMTRAYEKKTSMDARAITPLHGVTDRAKLRALKADMRRRGWVGDPVVVLNESPPKGVTGSHRVAAAAELGMRIPVIAVDPKSGLRHWRTGDDDAAVLRHLRRTPMAAGAFERGMPKTAAEGGEMIYHMDAFSWLQTLADESVDLIVTDYAYESLEKHRVKGTTTRLKHSRASSNDWFKTVPNSMIPTMLSEFWRVLKNNSHLYMFCDETSNHIWAANESLGRFKWWKRLVWDKVKMGMGYHYRAGYEFILFLEKGKRALNDKGVRAVFGL